NIDARVGGHAIPGLTERIIERDHPGLIELEVSDLAERDPFGRLRFRLQNVADDREAGYHRGESPHSAGQPAEPTAPGNRCAGGDGRGFHQRSLLRSRSRSAFLGPTVLAAAPARFQLVSSATRSLISPSLSGWKSSDRPRLSA